MVGQQCSFQLDCTQSLVEVSTAYPSKECFFVTGTYSSISYSHIGRNTIQECFICRGAMMPPCWYATRFTGLFFLNVNE